MCISTSESNHWNPNVKRRLQIFSWPYGCLKQKLHFLVAFPMTMARGQVLGKVKHTVPEMCL